MPKQASNITLAETTAPTIDPLSAAPGWFRGGPVPIVVHAHRGVLNTPDSGYHGVDRVLH
jgi:hypothetical protein